MGGRSENRLTAVALRALRPGDEEQTRPDGGGLWLRVRRARDGGAMTFYYRYEFAGRERRYTIGNYPAVSLGEARLQRDHLRASVGHGLDPAAQKNRDKQDRRAAEQAAQSRLTVRRLFERWDEQYLQTNRKDHGKEARRLFERDVFGEIGARSAESIQRRDIIELLDRVVRRGARRVANMLLAHLRQMFQFALVRELVATDPTIGIKKKDVGGEERQRDRTLSPNELIELARRLPAAELGVRADAAIRIMLACACRVGELSRARWEHIDLEAHTWIIPAEHAKNGQRHLIHLSAFARLAFEALLAVRTCQWIIPNRSDDGPIEQKAIGKQIRDRQRPSIVHGRSAKHGSLVLAGGTWTAHDLRRTAATLLGELGARPDVIDRCLNHIEPNRMIRTYQRQELLAERQRAFETLGAYLETRFAEEPAKVVLIAEATRPPQGMSGNICTLAYTSRH